MAKILFVRHFLVVVYSLVGKKIVRNVVVVFSPHRNFR